MLRCARVLGTCNMLVLFRCELVPETSCALLTLLCKVALGTVNLVLVLRYNLVLGISNMLLTCF